MPASGASASHSHVSAEWDIQTHLSGLWAIDHIHREPSHAMTAPATVDIPSGYVAITTLRRKRRSRGRTTTMQRLVRRIKIDDGGCWLWTGPIRPDGYTRMKSTEEGRLVYVHRYLYQRFNGPVPADKELDHVCRVRHCCNPEHLIVATHAENSGRQIARCSKLTHCKRGHVLSGDNVYPKDGRRHCRACRGLHTKAYRERKHGAA